MMKLIKKYARVKTAATMRTWAAMLRSFFNALAPSSIPLED
jgi:hypothetical protein